MTVDETFDVDAGNEPTKSELLECIRGLEARLERVEEENDELREKVSAGVENNAFRFVVARLVEKLTSHDVDDYTAEPHEYLDELSEVTDRINELEKTAEEHQATLDQFGHGKANGKGEAWHDVVEAAQNLEGTSENTVSVDGTYDVVLFGQNIQQATGFTERYCLDLIEEFGEKTGVTWKPYEPPSAGQKNNTRRKRLYVDLDVWGDD